MLNMRALPLKIREEQIARSILPCGILMIGFSNLSGRWHHVGKKIFEQDLHETPKKL